MLVLSRCRGQKVVISLADGTKIVVSVADLIGGKVRLGFEAPQHIRINRAEVEATREKKQ